MPLSAQMTHTECRIQILHLLCSESVSTSGFVMLSVWVAFKNFFFPVAVKEMLIDCNVFCVNKWKRSYSFSWSASFQCNRGSDMFNHPWPFLFLNGYTFHLFHISSRVDLCEISRIHFSFLLFNSLLFWFVPSSSLCELISFLALSQVMSCSQSCSRGGLMAQREEVVAVEEERPGLRWMMSSWLSHRSWSCSILCVNSTPSTRKSVASAAAAHSWTRSTPRSCR